MAVNEVPEQTLAGLGAHLRQARELKGLEVFDVATDLKLLESQVREMENGEYIHIKNLVFAKGYIRNYAQFLGMDVGQVLEWFDYASDSLRRESPQARRQRSWPTASAGVILALVLALLVGALWFGWQFLMAGEPSSAVSPPSGQVINIDIDPVAETSAASMADEPAIAVEQIENEASEQVPNAPELAMRFSADCWVEVRDADGKRLLADLKRKGDEVRLQGKAPLELIIGYVPAISVSYGGEDIIVLPENGQQSAKLLVGG